MTASGKFSSKKEKGGTRNDSDTMSFTACTLLRDIDVSGTSISLYSILDDMGDLYGHIKRCLFKDFISTGQSTITFKNSYLLRFRITARQFNAIRYDLDGNISAAVEILKNRIEDTKGNIKSIKKWINGVEAKIRLLKENSNLPAPVRSRKIHSIREAIHHKNRKLNAKELKVKALSDDLKNTRIRICFGSKSLFRKQFTLDENGYIAHSAWKADWKKSRGAQSFCLGSKDETSGNQTCTLSADGTLRIRIPNHLISKYGKYAIVNGIKFPYGQDIVSGALVSGQALTHRFVREAKGWYLHTSVDIKKPEPVTFDPRMIGGIGVDVNEKEIAVSESDRFGNLVRSVTYPACVKDRNSGQTEAIYGDICKSIIEMAASTGKPIIHENLDFRKKKATLKEQGVTYARMLSGFAYSSFITMLDRRAFKAGVKVFSVNPAFTSVIGRANHMSRYGITVHEAAALVIARRAQRYSESPAPARTASTLPVRNRGEHVWKFWRRSKESGVHAGMGGLFSRRRPLQGSTGSAETQHEPVHPTTALTSRPPAGDCGPLDTGKAQGVLPICKEGACANQGGNP